MKKITWAEGLNRTSVGLKPSPRLSTSSSVATASIEPAWD